VAERPSSSSRARANFNERRPRCIGFKGTTIRVGNHVSVYYKSCPRAGRKEVLVPNDVFERGAPGFRKVRLCLEHASPFLIDKED
jgi:hypothetical protein